MAIPVTCACNRRMCINPVFAGTTIDCPFCGQPLTIPAAGDSAEKTRGQGSSGFTLPAAGTTAGGRWLALAMSLVSTGCGLGAAFNYAYGNRSASMATGLAALGLLPAGIALIISQRPGTRFTAAPLIGLGLCACVIALLTLSSRHGGMVALAATESSVTRVSSGGPTQATSTPDAGQAVARQGQGDLSAVGPRLDSLPAQPLVTTHGPVEFRVTSARVEKPRVKELFFHDIVELKQPALVIAMQMRNGSSRRVVIYQVCRCRLVDEAGRIYDEVEIGTAQLVGRDLGDRKITAGGTLNEVFLFRVPGAEARSLVLEIPGAAVGDTDTVRILIPAASITR